MQPKLVSGDLSVGTQERLEIRDRTAGEERLTVTHSAQAGYTIKPRATIRALANRGRRANRLERYAVSDQAIPLMAACAIRLKQWGAGMLPIGLAQLVR